jgi:hypothetical protein
MINEAKLNRAINEGLGWRVEYAKTPTCTRRWYRVDPDGSRTRYEDDETAWADCPRYTESTAACFAVADAKGWRTEIVQRSNTTVLITSLGQRHNPKCWEVAGVGAHVFRTVAFAIAIANALGIDPAEYTEVET